MTTRLAALALLFGLGLVFYLSGLHDYLTIDGVKARLDDLRALYAARPGAVIAIFMFIQVTALALCLPGAVLAMSLAGGALFGPALGTAIVLASVTLGDSLGFLLARYVLRDLLAERFRAALDRVREGEGAAYLLALRMMAVVPYFVVNIAMALTPMPLRVFAPVSLLGLIPATALYVNAGASLSGIERASHIWTVPMVLTFLAIGLLPLAARWAYGRIRERVS